MGNDQTHVDRAKPEPLVKQAKFTWPPRLPIDPQDQVSEKHAQAKPPIHKPLSAWEALEQEWLCVTTQPLERRLADAGAAADPLNAYCWRCARTVGPYETDSGGCAKCRGTRTPWTRFVRVAEYVQPWSGIVQDAKFTRWPRLSVDLGRLLGMQLAAAIPDLDSLPTVVVPVPTSYLRRLVRGTDHSLNLARGVARQLGVPIRMLLSRSHRPEQARLSATDRMTNLNGSMHRAASDVFWHALAVTRAARWPGGAASARIIVVDDISTTGATMSETCRAVRRIAKSLSIKDLEIVAATICRTEERR